jgi:hypothetical protein
MPNYGNPNSQIGKGGLSGQYGSMPIQLYLDKTEQTCIYEEEDDLDNYFRSTLKDRTPDPSTLTQHQDRDKNTQNNIRRDILNIRHSGGRSKELPNHPDLFLGFTERDNRGSNTSGPDSRNLIKHSVDRIKFKDTLKDHLSDQVVPERPRNARMVYNDLRKSINPMKQRLKIFSTSEGTLLNSYISTTSNNNRLQNYETDGTNLSLNDSEETHIRKDNTAYKTDNNQIGYKQIGDHKFSVAHYGILSKKQKRANINEANKKVNGSHRFGKETKEIKNKIFVNIINEINKNKINMRKNEDNYYKYSNTNKTSIKKMITDLKKVQRSVKQSEDVNELAYTSLNKNMVKVYDPVNKDSVYVDKNVFSKVNEHKNITFVKKYDNNVRRSVNVNGLHKGGQEVHLYSRKIPEYNTQLPTKMEQKKTKSKNTLIFKNNHQQYSIMNSDSTQQEQYINNMGNKTFDTSKKGSGYHQHIRNDIYSKIDNGINDMTSGNRSKSKPSMGRQNQFSSSWS